MLLDLVAKYGSRKWSLIARMMPGRLGKQLRERYNNHLKPGLKVLFFLISAFYLSNSVLVKLIIY